MCLDYYFRFNINTLTVDAILTYSFIERNARRMVLEKENINCPNNYLINKKKYINQSIIDSISV